jgi:amidase
MRRGSAAALSIAVMLVCVPPSVAAPAQGSVCVENASLTELREALMSGRTTATALTQAYLARIVAYDRAGPQLNAVRELNPDALAIAQKLDEGRPDPQRPLWGIPILIKDNIATGDKQHTTAGSLALASARAKRDATVVTQLRHAGAVIMGKTNLTEFANILAVNMPSGYSSVGGQVRNPYAPELNEAGIPYVLPGGSSSGSAVATAAGLAAVTIGTETSGSLLSPANMNGLVTVKPTVGLISRAGILPIAASQDTAGPLVRSVRDAALMLNVLAARDPADAATRPQQRPADYTASLDANGLRGARIGVPSDPGDPANDVYYGSLPPRAAQVMRNTIAALEQAGAVIIRANMPTVGWMGGPGSDMPVLNLNPESATKNQPQRIPTVFVYELKNGLNAYLRDWATETPIKTMSDIVAFNKTNAGRALRFGQDIFLASEATRGDLSEPEYAAARQMDIRTSRTLGIDAYMATHQLDAILFPANLGAAIAAKAGYPSVEVPAGFVAGVNLNFTPDYPMGATFTGRAWSEPTLLRLAYAFEQATMSRRMPPGVPALDPSCAR